MPFKNQLQYEPKRKNRFAVSFPDDFGIVPWVIKSITRPKYTFSSKGKSKWDIIEIVFVDPISPSTSESLFKLITKIEELKKSQKSGQHLFSFDVCTLDPTGVTVETWKIDVRSVIYIDFGYANYESDEVQTPIMVVRPSKCELRTP